MYIYMVYIVSNTITFKSIEKKTFFISYVKQINLIEDLNKNDSCINLEIYEPNDYSNIIIYFEKWNKKEDYLEMVKNRLDLKFIEKNKEDYLESEILKEFNKLF